MQPRNKTWSRSGHSPHLQGSNNMHPWMILGWMLEVLLIVARINLSDQGPGHTIKNSWDGLFQYHDIH